MKLEIKDIAKMCHEANKAFCESQGDFSQSPWHLAETWQRVSAVNGVQYKIDNPTAAYADMHEAWLALKIKEGWQYGEVKNPKLFRHPYMVPYEDLPEEQKIKDKLFSSICSIFIPFISTKEPVKANTGVKLNPADKEAISMDAESRKPNLKKTLPSGKAMPVIK